MGKLGGHGEEFIKQRVHAFIAGGCGNGNAKTHGLGVKPGDQRFRALSR